jgi:type 1 glutamine amidotransferase
MRKTCLWLAGVALLTLNLLAAEAPKIKVLIVTGDDVGSHPWREVSQVTRDFLVAAGKFDVKICEDSAILDSAAALKRYDVVYLAMYNNRTPTLGDTAKQNLVEYVKGGKGFVASHLSSASFKEWDEFKKLCGRNWIFGKSGHGPRAPFQCQVADPEHPITKGLKSFEADDELYAKLQGDTPIKVLITANSDWSKQTEPLAFVLDYGQGRVFHHAFGHDGKALKSPEVQTLILRGVEWAARGSL